jgi:hypothetical protein
MDDLLAQMRCEIDIRGAGWPVIRLIMDGVF